MIPPSLQSRGSAMPKVRPDDARPRPASSEQQRDSALLKATTDLYCQEWQNDRDAARRYEEMALHLLPKVTLATRMHVAEALAARADAPLAVLVALAREEATTAAPVLARSTLLRPIDLLAIVAAAGPAHHRIVALRDNLPAEVATALRRTGNPDLIAILGPAIESPAPAVSPAEPAPAAGPVSAEADSLAARAVAGFLSLDRAERLRIIRDIAARHAGAARDSQPVRLDRAVRNAYRIAQIPAFARARDRAGLIAALAEVVRIDAALVARLVDDASGEPLAILLRAAGLTDMDARTLLLLANPAIGESVDAFRHAADLFTGLDPAVAESFVAAWRPKAARAEPRHQPAFADVVPVRARQPGERPALAPAAAPAETAPVARKA